MTDQGQGLSHNMVWTELFDNRKRRSYKGPLARQNTCVYYSNSPEIPQLVRGRDLNQTSISKSHALSLIMWMLITELFCFQVIEIVILIAVVMLPCLKYNRHPLQVELLYSFLSRVPNLVHFLLFGPAQ